MLTNLVGYLFMKFLQYTDSELLQRQNVNFFATYRIAKLGLASTPVIASQSLSK